MAAVTETVQLSVEEAILNRRSVRGFLDTPVPDETMRKIFELAQRAPSNCNIQPWKVFVASGETRDRIRETLIANVTGGVPSNSDYPYPGKFEGEYRRRQIECAVALYSTMDIGREDKEGRMRASLRNFELFDAPHVAFIGMEARFPTTVAVDVGMYAQTLMLAMTAYGVSSCAQGSMRNYPGLVRETFGADENIHIMFGISFGYEDPSVAANQTRTTREDIGESVVFKD